MNAWNILPTILSSITQERRMKLFLLGRHAALNSLLYASRAWFVFMTSQLQLSAPLTLLILRHLLRLFRTRRIALVIPLRTMSTPLHIGSVLSVCTQDREPLTSGSHHHNGPCTSRNNGTSTSHLGIALHMVFSSSVWEPSGVDTSILSSCSSGSRLRLR